MATRWPPMEDRGPQVTESDVVVFEKRFGHKLPKDYRQFLLDVNGGRLDIKNTQFDGGVVNQLFCLKDDDDASNLEVRADSQADAAFKQRICCSSGTTMEARRFC